MGKREKSSVTESLLSYRAVKMKLPLTEIGKAIRVAKGFGGKWGWYQDHHHHRHVSC